MTNRELMRQALSAFEAILFEKNIEATQIIARNARYSLREALAQPEQAPKLSDAGADTNIVRGLEPKGKGWVMFNQPNPEHQPWCDYLNIVLTSMPPQRANCNCKTAQPKQEPVAWMLPDYGDVLSASEADGTGIYNIPLYTAPPKPEPKSISTNDHLCAMLRQVHDVLACTALPMKRKWVGLTDEQLSETYNELYTQYLRDYVDIADFILIARTIESQLKELNT